MPPYSAEEESLLELEHVIGAGKYAGTFVSIPGKRDYYLKAMGSMLVVGELNDPSDQRMLHGHDETISALAVSPNGQLAASGQIGRTRKPGHQAPIIIWCLTTKKILHSLIGITHGVHIVKFSPDGQFLMGAGIDGIFAIFNTETGELVYGKRFDARQPIAMFQWVSVQIRGRRCVYRIAMAQKGSAQVQSGELFFEASRQQWSVTLVPVAMASSGLIRNYTCSTIFSSGLYLATGSTEGELFIFRLAENVQQGGVFRISIPLCGGSGLLAIHVLQEIANNTETTIFVGGDGQIKQLCGRDNKWHIMAQVSVDGAVNSLSLNGNTSEQLLIGTDSGKTYRILVNDMIQNNRSPALNLLSVAHIARPTAIAFGKTRSDVCCTVAEDGRLIVWDLSDYGALSMSKNESRSSKLGDGATCACWLRDVSIIAGFNDAQLRCFGAADGKTEWALPNAHRTPISALACHVEPSLAYLVSAAQDGAVRIWNLATRALILEFNEHKNKPITKIIIDNTDPMLFHSIGHDGALFTYDLRSERRTVAHVKRNPLFGLSQRNDADHEILTTDNNSILYVWDNDYSDPVSTFNLDFGPEQDTSSPPRSLSISPSGDFLALAKAQTIVIYQLTRNDPKSPPRLIALGHAHSDYVRDLQWSPDERQLISIADDTCLCVWNFYGSSSSTSNSS